MRGFRPEPSRRAPSGLDFAERPFRTVQRNQIPFFVRIQLMRLQRLRRRSWGPRACPAQYWWISTSLLMNGPVFGGCDTSMCASVRSRARHMEISHGDSTRTNACAHACVCACTNVCMHTWCVRVHVCAFVCSFVRVRGLTCIRVCVRTCV